jgi:hypothetical protein
MSPLTAMFIHPWSLKEKISKNSAAEFIRRQNYGQIVRYSFIYWG